MTGLKAKLQRSSIFIEKLKQYTNKLQRSGIFIEHFKQSTIRLQRSGISYPKKCSMRFVFQRRCMPLRVSLLFNNPPH